MKKKKNHDLTFFKRRLMEIIFICKFTNDIKRVRNCWLRILRLK